MTFSDNGGLLFREPTLLWNGNPTGINIGGTHVVEANTGAHVLRPDRGAGADLHPVLDHQHAGAGDRRQLRRPGGQPGRHDLEPGLFAGLGRHELRPVHLCPAVPGRRRQLDHLRREIPGLALAGPRHGHRQHRGRSWPDLPEPAAEQPDFGKRCRVRSAHRPLRRGHHQPARQRPPRQRHRLHAGAAGQQHLLRQLAGRPDQDGQHPLHGLRDRSPARRPRRPGLLLQSLHDLRPGAEPADALVRRPGVSRQQRHGNEPG